MSTVTIGRVWFRIPCGMWNEGRVGVCVCVGRMYTNAATAAIAAATGAATIASAAAATLGEVWLNRGEVGLKSSCGGKVWSNRGEVEALRACE